jgi:hypothetical protein
MSETHEPWALIAARGGHRANRANVARPILVVDDARLQRRVSIVSRA